MDPALEDLLDDDEVCACYPPIITLCKIDLEIRELTKENIDGYAVPDNTLALDC